MRDRTMRLIHRSRLGLSLYLQRKHAFRDNRCARIKYILIYQLENCAPQRDKLSQSFCPSMVVLFLTFTSSITGAGQDNASRYLEVGYSPEKSPQRHPFVSRQHRATQQLYQSKALSSLSHVDHTPREHRPHSTRYL